jgi:hypothetical protein
VLEGFGGTGDDSGGGEPVPPFAGLRTNDAAYIEYDSGERELYNLTADPAQLENLIKRADKSSVANLAGRLARLRKAGGKSGRALEDAPFSLVMPDVKHAARNGKRGRKGSRPATGKGHGGKRARANLGRRHARRAQHSPTPRPRRQPRLRRNRQP